MYKVGETITIHNNKEKAKMLDIAIAKIKERIEFLRKLEIIGCGMSIEELNRVLKWLGEE